MMELDEKELDRVDAYHRGELTAAEVADLRGRIENEPEFAEAVRQHEHLLKALEPTSAELADRAAFKAGFKQRQMERKGARTESAGAKVRPLRRWWLGAVAAVLFLMVAYFLVRPDQTVDPALEAAAVPHFTPLNRLGGRMSGAPALATQLAAAHKAYDTGDYATAAPLLNSPELVAADSLNLLFGAVAELGLGNEAAAIAALEAIRPTRFYDDNRAEIDFYLALGYLEAGEEEQALQLLRSVSQLLGFYGEEAGEVLRRIDEK